jgi:hypothetical protein
MKQTYFFLVYGQFFFACLKKYNSKKVVIISQMLKKLTPKNKPKLPPMFATSEKMSHWGVSSVIEYDSDS